MKKSLTKVVKDFLESNLQDGARILLGFSGGPDSLALMNLLTECFAFFNFQLHLAHIDHGWREESTCEANKFKLLADKLNLPFHLHRLSKVPKADKENYCRQERLKFFSKLNQEFGYQALILAHHGDDQAETFLKRICEGASLKGLGGLIKKRQLEEITIWRPLLSVRKKEIYDYLETKKLSPIYDSTNQDPKYLRGKMRTQIFPHLEKHFGKQIGSNFGYLSELFQEMQGYFDEKIQQITKCLVKGPFGDYLDLTPNFHSFELKYFFQKYAEQKGVNLSRAACDLLLELIKKKKPFQKIEAYPLTFHLNQTSLFIVKGEFPDFINNQSKWKRIDKKKISWLDFWKGEISWSKNLNQMVRLKELPSSLRTKIKKTYASKGVPAFFYDKVPLIVKEEEVTFLV